MLGGFRIARRVGHGLVSLLGPELGVMVKYGQGAGRCQSGARWAQGGLRRRRMASPTRGGAAAQATHRTSGGPVARGYN
jgi:hypothetical protein